MSASALNTAREKLLSAKSIECFAFEGMKVVNHDGSEEWLFSVGDQTDANELIELLGALQLSNLLRVTGQTDSTLFLEPIK